MVLKKMLVDATHPEETRVVVTNGNRIEEFDFESANRLQLRGNIYLAKVTRVEPSLQAAFVDYGGNRHGFLAFSEIHPDYYQIPVADREALLEQERLDEQADAAEDEKAAQATKEEKPKRRRRRSRSKAASVEADEVKGDAPDSEAEADQPTDAEASSSDEAASDEANAGEAKTSDTEDDDTSEDDDGQESDGQESDDKQIESVGSDDDDALEEVPVRRRKRAKTYKIQEVIKRRQILLIQVVKEERGNKGAALTTYLSLAGRYSVLMPNTARGGGISRKITNVSDRKRLKEIVGGLNVPEGMGIILRTAGASRTKTEVQRDFEYLLRLWENVRSLTLESSAPTLVYEEGSLIKRSIRDLYKKEIGEILVAGEVAHKEALGFMEMLMPSNTKNVVLYQESQPLFAKFNIESQLDAMFSPQVTLKSGGYLVINPTEALVSVDVNSGRSTKEHSIEDTALQTNLEAADEVARQLRLRDMAGLVVIDFIDMEENRNNRAVERRLKDALKSDRARIQVGRISHFGLMEMSRQRLRAGVLEGSTHICPHCSGTGLMRSVESVALLVLRAIEDHLMRKSNNNVKVNVRSDVALYILNEKRESLTSIEAQYEVSISIFVDESIGPEHFNIEKGDSSANESKRRSNHVRVDSHSVVQDEEKSSRRRGRGGRGGRNRDAARDEEVEPSEISENQTRDQDTRRADSDEESPRRRRRGRRGGKRNRNRNNDGNNDGNGAENISAPVELDDTAQSAIEAGADVAPTETEAVAEVAEKPKRRRSSRAAKPAVEADAATDSAPEATEEAPKKPRSRRRKKADDAESVSVEADAAPIEASAADAGTVETGAVETVPEETASVEAKKPRRKRAAPKKASTDDAATTSDADAPKKKPARKPRKKVEKKSADTGGNQASDTPAESDSTKKKGGWWQRGFLS